LGSSHRVLRGGVIGCGYFAQTHLNGWREVDGAEIVALCDRDSEALNQTAGFFGIERTYSDAETMLVEMDLDFVDVITQVGSHRELVELAAARKTHVICQKPFAPSVEDARNMVVSCVQSAVMLMVHENFRWQTPIRALKRVLTNRAIGNPFFGQISFRSAFDVYANQPYLATDDRFIVSDLGIHLLDLARFLMGDVEQMYTAYAAG
jgi:predicted dehydrogenase